MEEGSTNLSWAQPVVGAVPPTSTVGEVHRADVDAIKNLFSGVLTKTPTDLVVPDGKRWVITNFLFANHGPDDLVVEFYYQIRATSFTSYLTWMVEVPGSKPAAEKYTMVVEAGTELSVKVSSGSTGTQCGAHFAGMEIYQA